MSPFTHQIVDLPIGAMTMVPPPRDRRGAPTHAGRRGTSLAALGRRLARHLTLGRGRLASAPR